jgi:transcriptional regulator with XRE-family HTH domain
MRRNDAILTSACSENGTELTRSAQFKPGLHMSHTQDPGQHLRRVREHLGLRYRDVEEASQQIARNRDNQEFLVGLSRLADIENRGTLPSVYRLYSLCVIYGLDFSTVLGWYGVDLNQILADASTLSLRETRPIYATSPDFCVDGLPVELDQNLDLTKTIYLSEHVRCWGKLPLSILGALDLRRHRYAFIGTDDWFMYPILSPGSFVQIDETRKRLSQEPFFHEHERPIYFVEHRTGYRCAWCTERNGLLILQPHSASGVSLEAFRYPDEADILGRVVGVAKRLDRVNRRHTRS